MTIKKHLLKIILLLLVSLLSGFVSHLQSKLTSVLPKNQPVTDLSVLSNAYQNQKSNFQVIQSGRIIKELRDDVSGLRHQKFLVQLESGQKLLIAHNIDIAQKVDGLNEGEQISFSGEYEWNNKGGVVHWTHKDPRGKHTNGWLHYHGKVYD